MKHATSGHQMPQERRDGAGAGAGATPARTDAPRALSVTVPLLRPLLTPKARLHWAARARATKEQRELGYWAARSVLHHGAVPLAGAVRLDVAVRPLPRMQPHDADNFWSCLKPYIDGLADAGLVANDRQFVLGDLVWDKDNRTGYLVFTLREEG